MNLANGMSWPPRILPISASTIAPAVDRLSIALLISSGIVLTGITAWITLSCIRYREGSPASRRQSAQGMSREWLGILAILCAFVAIFLWAVDVYFQMHVAPPGAEEVTVVGKQWMWKFQHPDGQSELGELHVAVGQPVELVMTSQDVVHSFFVPAFRIKQDVLPGRYTRTWFEATRAGEYDVFCTQYCGLSHSAMRARVIALQAADYQRWLETGLAAAPRPVRPEELGSRIFNRMGCASCHSSQGSVRAPDLQGLYGSSVALSNGTNVLADPNYLRESILNPQAKIVQGYPNLMPAFSGLLSEEEVLALIAYIRNLKEPSR